MSSTITFVSVGYSNFLDASTSVDPPIFTFSLSSVSVGRASNAFSALANRPDNPKIRLEILSISSKWSLYLSHSLGWANCITWTVISRPSSSFNLVSSFSATCSALKMSSFVEILAKRSSWNTIKHNWKPPFFQSLLSVNLERTFLSCMKSFALVTSLKNRALLSAMLENELPALDLEKNRDKEIENQIENSPPERPIWVSSDTLSIFLYVSFFFFSNWLTTNQEFYKIVESGGSI